MHTSLQSTTSAEVLSFDIPCSLVLVEIFFDRSGLYQFCIHEQFLQAMLIQDLRLNIMNPAATQSEYSLAINMTVTKVE